ncbi:MAG: chorismate lyase [Candidatus Symbiodolus clandestinus]
MDNQQRRSTPLLMVSNWFQFSMPELPKWVAAWLLDEGSTTTKFQQCCGCLQIECCFEGYLSQDDLSEEISSLAMNDEPVWLREVLMMADGIPWLYGRSLIPKTLLEHPDLALSTLGNTPLGARLFSLPKPPKREAIQITQVLPTKALTLLANQPTRRRWWARRSRLSLPQGALLLTELFLPASPLYQSSDE